MDILYKGLAFDNQISVTVIEATEMVNEAIKIHSLSPLAAAALGRTLIAGTFMASTLKGEDDRLSITLSGDGVGGHIVVAGDSFLNMRGYIDEPHCELPLNAKGKLDVAGCVGKGRITVLKSMGLKEPYTGSAQIVSGEIAEDFASYYTFSEQQPTGMALGVKIGTDLTCVGAGGVIFQTLPGATDEAIDKAESLLLTLGDISSVMQNEGAENFVKRAFSDYSYQTFKHKYSCVCSKEYIDSMLLTLGKRELYQTLQKEGKIEVHCHFCNKKYTYDEEAVNNLIINAISKKE
ncbi:MAG: Hsp33 family molecular chaperone HslO [Clostridia bacterium]|nr:Hsp33 family molecular chaperone HslO [Clostridia bacterium]